MLPDRLPPKINELLTSHGIEKLRPGQEKAVEDGLLDFKSMLICTPTASGKTVIAEMAFLNHFLEKKGKAIYIVPLKALASEKFHEFKKKYDSLFRTALSSGDLDKTDNYLAEYDLIVCTAEKLDSLMRHKCEWLQQVSLVVIDEIHLLNDQGRGPTLEIIIIMLRRLIKDIQILGLSATIGNPEELADWLGAVLVKDDWRPVELKKGVYFEGEVEFYK
ncbi:DEAD/DEAH box helicase [Candidatus Woesearchaeota archaeon]|nr:DEAD/DEAH box helicase [Candidatus Woesearchaeota archaeon]